MSALVDARTLSKLKWRCRRGLLENDLFVERFFASRGDAVTTRQAEGLGVLMDLPDNDLLDLLLRRTEPQGDLRRDDVTEVLALMRTPITAAALGMPTVPSVCPPSEAPRSAIAPPCSRW